MKTSSHVDLDPIPDLRPRSRNGFARVLAGLSSLAIGLVSVSCTTTTPAFDEAKPLKAATSMTPPAGQGVVVGRLKLEISESPQYHAGDGLLLIGSDGGSYRLRTDREGWFCVWLPIGWYRCESMVAYLGQPEWPVDTMCPQNAFEVMDQEVEYLGTLKAITRLVEADLGYNLWIEVVDFGVVDEGTKAIRALATRYGSPPPPFRTALVVLGEPE